jgi:acetyl-CoA carboxylase biotin carboxyl carrier protein
MSLTPHDITSIVSALQESSWDEAEVVIGDVKISVARNGARLSHSVVEAAAVSAPVVTPVAPAAPAVAPTSAAPAPVAASSSVPSSIAPAGPVEGSTDHVVKAPSVGVFWAASEPGAPAFVEIGSTVGAESTVCIVEIMKLMNNVSAGVSGTITAIHVVNGESVQFGAPLFSIRTDAS